MPIVINLMYAYLREIIIDKSFTTLIGPSQIHYQINRIKKLILLLYLLLSLPLTSISSSPEQYSDFNLCESPIHLN